MTLKTRSDAGRYVVSDGAHTITDLSRDEWLLLLADFNQGQHTAEQLFANAARRHLTTPIPGGTT